MFGKRVAERQRRRWLMRLRYLIAEATSLAGGNLCAAGHDWQSDGGRPCPRSGSECTQTVYRCARCGVWDYGDPGGPGHADCNGVRLCSSDVEQYAHAHEVG